MLVWPMSSPKITRMFGFASWADDGLPDTRNNAVTATAIIKLLRVMPVLPCDLEFQTFSMARAHSALPVSASPHGASCQKRRIGAGCVAQPTEPLLDRFAIHRTKTPTKRPYVTGEPSHAAWDEIFEPLHAGPRSAMEARCDKRSNHGGAGAPRSGSEADRRSAIHRVLG